MRRGRGVNAKNPPHSVSSPLYFPDGKESLYPMPVEDLYMDPERRERALTLVPSFSGTQFREVCVYPIIVEGWDKRLHGPGRRRYHETFSDTERATIGRWQTQFRVWYLVTGTPRRVQLTMQTLALLQRAVDFFASI